MEKQILKERILRKILRHPFICSIFVAGIICLTFIFLVAPRFEATSKDPNHALGAGLIGWIILFVILALVGLLLQDKYITYIGENDTHLMYLIRVSPEGKVLETGQTMWGKERIYGIKKPNIPNYDKNRNKIGFITGAKIVARHTNSETIIPVSIEVVTNGDYNPQELYDKMIAQMNTSNIDEFVEKIFLASAEANKETIDQTAKEYAEKKISSIQLLERIISVVEFPEKALKNFKDVRICLDNPTARACKGTSCEQV